MRKIALLSILMILVMVAGCSRTRLAYNLSGWFVLHRIDRYFDITAEQKAFLEPRIDQLKTWHRHVELPKLVRALEELETRYQAGLKAEDLDWIEETHLVFWRRFIARGLPDFSTFLGTVTEEQVQSAERRMADNRDYLEDQRKMTPAELRQDILDWLYEFLEEWYGSLDGNQKDRIRQWVKEDPEWIALKLEHRSDFQKRLAALMRAPLSGEERLRALAALILEPRSQGPEKFYERLDAKRREWKQIFLKVDALMRPDQRRRVLDLIESYTEDFRTLVG